MCPGRKRVLILVYFLSACLCFSYSSSEDFNTYDAEIKTSPQTPPPSAPPVKKKKEAGNSYYVKNNPPVLSQFVYYDEIYNTKRPSIRWEDAKDEDSGDSVSYMIQFKKPDTGKEFKWLGPFKETTFNTKKDLDDHTRWSFRLKAIDKRGAENVSLWYDFVINTKNEPPSSPELITNEGTLLTTDNSLSWKESFDPDPEDKILKYEIQIASDEKFNELLFKNITYNTLVKLSELKDIEKNKRYFWRVIAVDKMGLKAFSKTSFFEIGMTAGDKKLVEAIRNSEIKMVLIKGGCFSMGDVFGDGDRDERPEHTVCINDFYISETEITQEKWKKIMGGNPSEFKDDERPVENVSWNDAREFLKRLNENTGDNYRLPTEAEWEYVAREEGKQIRYPTGSNDMKLGDANYWGTGGRDRWDPGAAPVKSFSPNSIGIYDMAGNVWEWCVDIYSEDYYSNSVKDNPRGPSSGLYRVLRGGSWYDLPGDMRASNRYRANSDLKNNMTGFRVARDALISPAPIGKNIDSIKR